MVGYRQREIVRDCPEKRERECLYHILRKGRIGEKIKLYFCTGEMLYAAIYSSLISPM
jgi:hypothetical protein